MAQRGPLGFCGLQAAGDALPVARRRLGAGGKQRLRARVRPVWPLRGPIASMRPVGATAAASRFVQKHANTGISWAANSGINRAAHKLCG